MQHMIIVVLLSVLQPPCILCNVVVVVVYQVLKLLSGVVSDLALTTKYRPTTTQNNCCYEWFDSEALLKHLQTAARAL